MSKPPFWQPGDKWLPPIVRIKGVETHSKEGQAILQRFSGQIRQFYLGQARNHALGVTQHTKVTRDFPDARMQYTNMSGQEILDIEVRPAVQSQPTPTVENPVLPWDWFLVEIHFPVPTSIAYMDFRARRTVPAADEAGIRNEGWVTDAAYSEVSEDGLTPPVTAYPNEYLPYTTTSDENTRVSSLRIDLRRFPGLAAMAINLEAVLHPAGVTELVGYSRSSGSVTFGEVSTVGTAVWVWDVPTTEGHWAVDPWDSTPYGGNMDLEIPQYVAIADIPAPPVTETAGERAEFVAVGSFDPLGMESITAAGDFGYEYDPVSGLMTGRSIGWLGLGGVDTPLSDLEPGSEWIYNVNMRTDVIEYAISPDYETVTPTDPISEPATIRGVGGFGVPPWEGVTVETPDVRAWHWRFGVPDGESFRFLPTRVMETSAQLRGPATVEDPFYLVGTLRILPQVYAATFEPA